MRGFLGFALRASLGMTPSIWNIWGGFAGEEKMVGKSKSGGEGRAAGCVL
jgi:hypothetical protein